MPVTPTGDTSLTEWAAGTGTRMSARRGVANALKASSAPPKPDLEPGPAEAQESDSRVAFAPTGDMSS